MSVLTSAGCSSKTNNPANEFNTTRAPITTPVSIAKEMDKGNKGDLTNTPLQIFKYSDMVMSQVEVYNYTSLRFAQVIEAAQSVDIKTPYIPFRLAKGDSYLGVDTSFKKHLTINFKQMVVTESKFDNPRSGEKYSEVLLTDGIVSFNGKWFYGLDGLPENSMFTFQMDSLFISISNPKNLPQSVIQTIALQFYSLQQGIYQRGTGFLDTKVINQWSGIINDHYTDVYAGAIAANPTQGVIIINQEWGDSVAYPTPTKHGAVEIIKEDQLKLTLRAKDGTIFIFNIKSKSY
jgi:hypothetical protein